MIKTILLSIPLFAIALAGAGYLIHSERTPEDTAAKVEAVAKTTAQKGKKWFDEKTAAYKKKVAQANKAPAAEKPEEPEVAQKEAAKPKKKPKVAKKPKAAKVAKKTKVAEKVAEEAPAKTPKPARRAPRGVVTADALFGEDTGAPSGDLEPVEPVDTFAAIDPSSAQVNSSRLQALQQQRMELDARLARIGQ